MLTMLLDWMNDSNSLFKITKSSFISRSIFILLLFTFAGSTFLHNAMKQTCCKRAVWCHQGHSYIIHDEVIWMGLIWLAVLRWAASKLWVFFPVVHLENPDAVLRLGLYFLYLYLVVGLWNHIYFSTWSCYSTISHQSEKKVNPPSIVTRKQIRKLNWIVGPSK